MLSIVSIATIFILLTITNTPFQWFLQGGVFASTQQQQEEDQGDSTFDNAGDINEEDSGLSNTTQESEGSEQTDSNDTNNESSDPRVQDQNQVQQPQQIDTISPKISSVTPNYGTSGIPVTTTITAIFNEEIDASTVNASNFELLEDNSKVKGIISLSQDGKTAVFTPSSPLSGSTIYTASISDVKDLAGNTMNFNSPWSFTTEAQAAPPSQIPSSPSQQQPPPENSDRVKTAPPIDTDILTQQPPSQQPSPSNPSTPSNPGGGGNPGGSGGSGGGILDDIKTSPTEKDVLRDAAQYVEDEKLVDRILPIILSKMDKRQLAATVLPYLDFTPNIYAKDAQAGLNSAGDGVVTADCDAGDIAISGGGGYSVPLDEIEVQSFNTARQGTGAWTTTASLEEGADGYVFSHVYCSDVTP